MKQVLLLTDMEGLLVSSKKPELDGRKYMVAVKTEFGKKYITKANVERLKELNLTADIVPMTKLAARQCNAVSLCIPTPMSLVESGAVLLDWTKPRQNWEGHTMEVIYPDSQLLYNGRRLLEKKGYRKNGDNEFTLDYIGIGKDSSNDAEELEKEMGGKFKILCLEGGRIYAYHKMLSRREMVSRFLDTVDYQTVITAAAPFTGWMPMKGNTISSIGTQAKYTYDGDYNADPHAFAAYVLDTALSLSKV